MVIKCHYAVNAPFIFIEGPEGNFFIHSWTFFYLITLDVNVGGFEPF